MKTNQLKQELQDAAQAAVRLVANAASEAGKTIASAAEQAKLVVATNAADAAKILATKNMDGVSDHDTLNSLVTATTINFANLKDSQAKFHEEMKQSFADLKDNYANRLTDVEKRIEINGKRITSLETSKTRQNVMMSIGIGILTILTGILITHIVK
jgi:uncharacterized protein YijF (DUF1287 family)